MESQRELEILERETTNDNEAPCIEAIETMNVDQNGDDCAYCAGRPSC